MFTHEAYHADGETLISQDHARKVAQSCRLAAGGAESDHDYTWGDKPHRLVYDLAKLVDDLADMVDNLSK